MSVLSRKHRGSVRRLQRPGSASLSSFHQLSLVSSGLFAFWALISSCADNGFECGREVPGKPGTFRRCDRADEICVCHTNSCARSVAAAPEGDAGTSFAPDLPPPDRCPSGWRYVESPFARSDLAGSCVTQSQIDLGGGKDKGLLSFAEGELVCPGSPVTPTPVDAGPNPPPTPIPDAHVPEPDEPDATPVPVDDGGPPPLDRAADSGLEDGGGP